MDWCTNVLMTFVGVAIGAFLSWLIQKYSELHLLRRLREAVRDRQHVSLGEQFLLCRILARKIKAGGFKPEAIFAVSPGGAMVAEWLSRRFLGTWKKPIPVFSIWVHTVRTGGPGMEVDIATINCDMQTIGAGFPKDTSVLLVTDICRSGNTLRAAHDFLKSHIDEKAIRTAALLRNVVSPVHPKYVTDDTQKTVIF
ncbi:MAG: phosphoribosyltransferase family protein [Planctomycetota bacterium]|nr:phosphoribosyltransferase family protein [Planctomycetota bacterium]